MKKIFVFKIFNYYQVLPWLMFHNKNKASQLFFLLILELSAFLVFGIVWYFEFCDFLYLLVPFILRINLCGSRVGNRAIPLSCCFLGLEQLPAFLWDSPPHLWPSFSFRLLSIYFFNCWWRENKVVKGENRCHCTPTFSFQCKTDYEVLVWWCLVPPNICPCLNQCAQLESKGRMKMWGVDLGVRTLRNNFIKWRHLKIIML